MYFKWTKIILELQAEKHGDEHEDGEEHGDEEHEGEDLTNAPDVNYRTHF